jgi:hypothetical protein
MQDLFYDLIWSQIVKAIATRIITFFALSSTSFFGGIGIAIVTKLLKIVTDIIYDHLKMYIDVKAIQFKNQILQAKWQAASDQLDVALIEYGQDSEEFKAKHKKEQEGFYETFTFNTRNTAH